MKLSYVIVTHNRRERLLQTLAHLLDHEPLPADQREIFVVDNGSDDGAAEAVRGAFPGVRVIARPTNEGVWARNYAFAEARGRYITLLDDDSYPIGDATARSLAYLDAHGDVGAVVGKVLLPDGREEACALPAVMISCAVCLRASAIRRVGGFRREFFRKAGEYDLSYRLWDAGWRVERFDDIVYRHDKFTGGRSAELAHFMDLRNNLILVERYLPRPARRAVRGDTLRRYVAIAKHARCADAAARAIIEARQWAADERRRGRPELLSGPALETIYQWDAQARAVAAWAKHAGVRRVVIADLAKNLFATWRAARCANLRITAIADDGPAFAHMNYRGVPVMPIAEALRPADGAEPGGVILANVNPAQVDARLAAVRQHFAGPVLRLWRPQRLSDTTAAPITAPEADAA